MGHSADFSISPLIAILADFEHSVIPESVQSSFLTFNSTQTIRTSAFSPPWDSYPRNITTYLSPNLTIGAESFNETVVGGPAKNSNTFSPAVVQWSRDDGTIGWLSLYAEVTAMDVHVSEGLMNLTYPRGSEKSRYTFLVGTGKRRDVSSWDDIEGVTVRVEGTIDVKPVISFNGLNGGAGVTIK